MSELKNNQSKPFVSKVLRLLKNTFTLSIFTRITTSFSKYRRSGINTYAACKRWEYYREMGKLGEIGAILKNNEAAIMVWNKLGEKILGEGRLLRLFGIVIWKEKPL